MEKIFLQNLFYTKLNDKMLFIMQQQYYRYLNEFKVVTNLASPTLDGVFNNWDIAEINLVSNQSFDDFRLSLARLFTDVYWMLSENVPNWDSNFPIPNFNNLSTLDATNPVNVNRLDIFAQYYVNKTFSETMLWLVSLAVKSTLEGRRANHQPVLTFDIPAQFVGSVFEDEDLQIRLSKEILELVPDPLIDSSNVTSQIRQSALKVNISLQSFHNYFNTHLINRFFPENNDPA